MKNIVIISILFLSANVFAQKGHYNVGRKNVAVSGYDLVSYFEGSGTPVKGNKKFTTSYDDITYVFSSADNLEKFKANPGKYMPQYGGYCAYAVAKTGDKVSVDPKTFEIRDGKLYLFYNSWGNNTLKSWGKEDPAKLRPKADANWEKLTKN
ncbi:YHS domain-containing protein [Flavobacteriaceae bacterium R38]|nr:YHS domain-containing protein [Flavobacteriaceae bacterium R38]